MIITDNTHKKKHKIENQQIINTIKQENNNENIIPYYNIHHIYTKTSQYTDKKLQELLIEAYHNKQSIQIIKETIKGCD